MNSPFRLIFAALALMFATTSFALTRDVSNPAFWFDKASDGSPIVHLHYFTSTPLRARTVRKRAQYSRRWKLGSPGFGLSAIRS